MLNTITVHAKGGRTFLVTEPNIGQMLPFMRNAKDDTIAAMMELMRVCVSETGVALGDQLEQLPGSMFSALSEAMTKVAGLNGDTEGNAA